MIKVLVVDDSALIRKLLSRILSKDADIEVVGSAEDAFVARDKIKQLKPDVLTLDIEMPKMDGLTFLGNLMRLHPLPVVMVSALTDAGAGMTLKALELGAVDYIGKPSVNTESEMLSYAEELTTKVKLAARANIRSGFTLPDKLSVSIVEPGRRSNINSGDKVIAIGASTGGTEAIKEILCELPKTTPGIVISQHIPESFSRAFAERLNQNSALSVSEASEGARILNGHAYVAPGNRHLEVQRDGSHYICRLSDAAAVNRHKPSVEVMFKSVAAQVGANAVCVLLTGMGDDGSDAMGVMQSAGAPTIAQDEQSSVVWGMPGEAVKRGYADDVLPLHYIAEKILHYAYR